MMARKKRRPNTPQNDGRYIVVLDQWWRRRAPIPPLVEVEQSQHSTGAANSSENDVEGDETNEKSKQKKAAMMAPIAPTTSHAMRASTRIVSGVTITQAIPTTSTEQVDTSTEPTIASAVPDRFFRSQRMRLNPQSSSIRPAQPSQVTTVGTSEGRDNYFSPALAERTRRGTRLGREIAERTMAERALALSANRRLQSAAGVETHSDHGGKQSRAIKSKAKKRKRVISSDSETDATVVTKSKLKKTEKAATLSSNSIVSSAEEKIDQDATVVEDGVIFLEDEATAVEGQFSTDECNGEDSMDESDVGSDDSKPDTTVSGVPASFQINFEIDGHQDFPATQETHEATVSTTPEAPPGYTTPEGPECVSPITPQGSPIFPTTISLLNPQTSPHDFPELPSPRSSVDSTPIQLQDISQARRRNISSGPRRGWFALHAGVNRYEQSVAAAAASRRTRQATRQAARRQRATSQAARSNPPLGRFRGDARSVVRADSQLSPAITAQIASELVPQASSQTFTQGLTGGLVQASTGIISHISNRTALTAPVQAVPRIVIHRAQNERLIGSSQRTSQTNSQADRLQVAGRTGRRNTQSDVDFAAYYGPPPQFNLANARLIAQAAHTAESTIAGFPNAAPSNSRSVTFPVPANVRTARQIARHEGSGYFMSTPNRRSARDYRLENQSASNNVYSSAGNAPPSSLHQETMCFLAPLSAAQGLELQRHTTNLPAIMEPHNSRVPAVTPRQESRSGTGVTIRLFQRSTSWPAQNRAAGSVHRGISVSRATTRIVAQRYEQLTRSFNEFRLCQNNEASRARPNLTTQNSISFLQGQSRDLNQAIERMVARMTRSESAIQQSNQGTTTTAVSQATIPVASTSSLLSEQVNSGRGGTVTKGKGTRKTAATLTNDSRWGPTSRQVDSAMRDAELQRPAPTAACQASGESQASAPPQSANSAQPSTSNNSTRARGTSSSRRVGRPRGSRLSRGAGRNARASERQAMVVPQSPVHVSATTATEASRIATASSSRRSIIATQADQGGVTNAHSTTANAASSMRTEANRDADAPPSRRLTFTAQISQVHASTCQQHSTVRARASSESGVNPRHGQNILRAATSGRDLISHGNIAVGRGYESEPELHYAQGVLRNSAPTRSMITMRSIPSIGRHTSQRAAIDTQTDAHGRHRDPARGMPAERRITSTRGQYPRESVSNVGRHPSRITSTSSRYTAPGEYLVQPQLMTYPHYDALRRQLIQGRIPTLRVPQSMPLNQVNIDTGAPSTQLYVQGSIILNGQLFLPAIQTNPGRHANPTSSSIHRHGDTAVPYQPVIRGMGSQRESRIDRPSYAPMNQQVGYGVFEQRDQNIDPALYAPMDQSVNYQAGHQHDFNINPPLSASMNHAVHYGRAYDRASNIDPARFAPTEQLAYHRSVHTPAFDLNAQRYGFQGQTIAHGPSYRPTDSFDPVQSPSFGQPRAFYGMNNEAQDVAIVQRQYLGEKNDDEVQFLGSTIIPGVEELERRRLFGVENLTRMAQIMATPVPIPTTMPAAAPPTGSNTVEDTTIVTTVSNGSNANNTGESRRTQRSRAADIGPRYNSTILRNLQAFPVAVPWPGPHGIFPVPMYTNAPGTTIVNYYMKREHGGRRRKDGTTAPENTKDSRNFNMQTKRASRDRENAIKELDKIRKIFKEVFLTNGPEWMSQLLLNNRKEAEQELKARGGRIRLHNSGCYVHDLNVQAMEHAGLTTGQYSRNADGSNSAYNVPGLKFGPYLQAPIDNYDSPYAPFSGFTSAANSTAISDAFEPSAGTMNTGRTLNSTFRPEAVRQSTNVRRRGNGSGSRKPHDRRQPLTTVRQFRAARKLDAGIKSGAVGQLSRRQAALAGTRKVTPDDTVISNDDTIYQLSSSDSDNLAAGSVSGGVVSVGRGPVAGSAGSGKERRGRRGRGGRDRGGAAPRGRRNVKPAKRSLAKLNGEGEYEAEDDSEDSLSV